ncbi:major facilitator superfamily domain-containing protein [Zychaea mexicana]|uniref:major facilitator superfamily domain-containing protein n=1 Tax=Zychaea mexicana TaxID=64656 RepID=UPI0022FEE022|nr:major facilitator superfamily domain-containing protein [Zychaea mexicana]KAI9498456.1 major facilitator superfamily domain-containing protein [Zychaea mexicana]
MSDEKDISYEEDVKKTTITTTSTSDEVQVETETTEKSEEEKEYLRKLNWIVLPFAGMTIFLNFCDKSALSVGPVLGLNADLGLTGQEFSLLGSLFYLGHLVYQLPNQFMLQRVPHARYLGVLLCIWGLVMTLTALTQNFAQMAACRFLLGLFEAAAMPTLYLVTSILYRRSEQTLVFGFITLCNGVGAAVGSAIAYGIAHMGHPNGIQNWRWNHYIFGALTILHGFIVYFFMVDTPKHKKLKLTPAEERIADARMKDNAVTQHREFKYAQIWECLKEARWYLLVIAAFCISMQNGGMLVYSTTFTMALGFSPLDSMLLQIPSGFASSLGVLAAMLIARKTGQLLYTGIGLLIIGMIGLVLLCAIPEGEVKLLGFYLSWAGTGAYSLLLTYVGNNAKGYTKKIFYNGCIVAAYTLGNFAGPLMMVEHEAPRYLSGVGGYLAGFGVAAIAFLIVRIQAARTNKKRIANGAVGDVNLALDLTDQEDEQFLYRV